MADDRRVQDLLVERLRSPAERAGGLARAEPCVLHYLVAHAEYAGPDDNPVCSPLPRLPEGAKVP